MEHHEEGEQDMDTSAQEAQPNVAKAAHTVDFSEVIRTETLDELKEGLLRETMDKEE